MKKDESLINEAKELIKKETKIVKEIIKIKEGLKQNNSTEIKSLAKSQIKSLKKQLGKTVDDVESVLEDMSMTKPLPKTNLKIDVDVIKPKKDIKIKEKKYNVNEKKEKKKKHKIVDVSLDELERKTIKRIKKRKQRLVKIKKEKANPYVRFSNKVFGDTSKKLAKTDFFKDLNRDLIKANLKFVISSYISVIFMTCLIAAFIGFFVMVFFLFFEVSAQLPIIFMAKGSILARLLKFFWIPIAAPLVTFLGLYVYPAIEKSYIENKINQELPFATIHMSAISGSMIEPSKIFSIIISTKEYPFLEKEFTKIINQINVYGYDFVSALRNVAFNSPSTKLTELLNGIATTINSGGGLDSFFDKRSQTLLFEYKIEREKYTKTSETFMDIYISVVIAAPMILMLLLMMMRVSGLGLSLSTSMITLVMILGVTMVNIIFLVFLQLKQPST